MRTVVTSPITHLCPHVDEVDHGTIVLTFDGEAPELHGIRKYLDLYATQKVSHEQLTKETAAFYGCEVVTRWTTAGLAVECCAP